MAGPIGTQARITVDSPLDGSVRLKRCKDSKIADGASVEGANAVGEDDPVGFVDKPGVKTITLSVYEEQGVKPEVDYHALKDGKIVFSMTRAIVGGRSEQYPTCRVSKIDKDDDAEGSHMISVEIIALTRKPL